MRIIATTTRSNLHISDSFSQFLAETGYELVQRANKSLEKLRDEYQAAGIIVWKDNSPQLYIQDQRYFFHPSMAKIRITKFIKDGTLDPMVEACGLDGTQDFLDCTLGMGSDAIVAAYFNPSRRVVGVEKSPLVASITKWGMRLYESSEAYLVQAVERVEVISMDHMEYLRQQPDNAYDIVYFDPMFRTPLLKSQAISPLRLIASDKPLERSVIEEACRVARQRVVMKEAVFSREFERLGFNKVDRSRNRKIAFGIIQING
jgi:16S rRNA (guanine1516-N2)-methyltransferase